MYRLIIIICFLGIRGYYGDSLPEGKIVGGSDADISEFPYQLSFLLNNVSICGASILSDKWAITAGHCTFGTKVSELQIRAGSSFSEEGGQLIPIKSVYMHPNFSIDTMDYDISLLELSQNIIFGKSSLPIILATSELSISEGTFANVSGWGDTRQKGDIPVKLQVVTVPIVYRDKCREDYKDVLITDRMICAGFPDTGGKDSCQGDSGGPLVINNTLVGIVSWGYGCARPMFPGVYAFIPTLREFIHATTGL